MLSGLLFTETLLLILIGYMMITTSTAICVVISNIISAVMVFIYCVLQAPDIAITEAVIGVATSTILFALTLLYIKKLPANPNQNTHFNAIDIRQRMFVFLLCVLLFFIFIYIIQNIPTGDKASRISVYYIKNAFKDFTMPSIVTSVVAGYRACDTMFENVVIFTACYGFYTLLTMDNDEKNKKTEKKPAQNQAESGKNVVITA